MISEPTFHNFKPFTYGKQSFDKGFNNCGEFEVNEVDGATIGLERNGKIYWMFFFVLCFSYVMAILRLTLFPDE